MRYAPTPEGYRAALDAMRARPRQHKDNVFLVTGDEGSGKSQLTQRIGADLDPHFTDADIHFGAIDFLSHASTYAPGRVVVADEIETTGRRATSKENVDLLLFLKECRGLRLNIFILWPHLATFDQAILRDRVQWLIEIVKPLGMKTPATWVLRERQTQRVADKTGNVETTVRHVVKGSWTFRPKPDPRFAGYAAKKQNHMASLSRRYAAKQAERDHESAQDLAADPELASLAKQPFL